MLINNANMDAMFRGYNAKYRDSFDKAPSHWDKLAMKMPSTGRDETYAWLGLFPSLSRPLK
jgi:phage major head subunit gpT-like protein